MTKSSLLTRWSKTTTHMANASTSKTTDPCCNVPQKTQHLDAKLNRSPLRDTEHRLNSHRISRANTCARKNRCFFSCAGSVHGPAQRVLVMSQTVPLAVLPPRLGCLLWFAHAAKYGRTAGASISWCSLLDFFTTITSPLKPIFSQIDDSFPDIWCSQRVCVCVCVFDACFTPRQAVKKKHAHLASKRRLFQRPDQWRCLVCPCASHVRPLC